MSKKIYLYFAKSNKFESWQKINGIAIRQDISTGMATCVYMVLELDEMIEIKNWASELDKIFGLVFQKFIQAPKIDVSVHYEGKLTLPLLMVDNPQAIHKTTGEILELTIKQWGLIGELLEERLGIEFLEARDYLINKEEVLADILGPGKIDYQNNISKSALMSSCTLN